jgi:hypothetical protein
MDSFSIERVPKKQGIRHLGPLRWVFKFADGRPDKIGVWNGATNNFEESAAYISKTGIVYAAIEWQPIGKWVNHKLFECDGHDYVSSRWIAATNAGCGIGISSGKKKLSNAIVGLMFITRNKKVSCFVDGSISQKNLNEYEKKFNLREHRI